jgi:hypothetical protein
VVEVVQVRAVQIPLAVAPEVAVEIMYAAAVRVHQGKVMLVGLDWEQIHLIILQAAAAVRALLVARLLLYPHLLVVLAVLGYQIQ